MSAIEGGANEGRRVKKKKPKNKVEKTMHEFKMGTLHSGSKKGPMVKGRKQAIAIALNQQRKKGRPKNPMRGRIKGAKDYMQG